MDTNLGAPSLSAAKPRPGWEIAKFRRTGLARRHSDDQREEESRRGFVRDQRGKFLPKSLRFSLTAGIVGALLVVSAALAQDFPGANSNLESKPANAMVAYLFPEQISIPAQKSTAVDLHFRVADGLHINSHTPREKSLIPTNLAIVETPALKVTRVDFPPGADYSFAFDPKEKLSVYTGDFVLRAHLTAPAGNYVLQGVLRYQACNSNSCYPPKTIPVALNVIAK